MFQPLVPLLITMLLIGLVLIVHAFCKAKGAEMVCWNPHCNCRRGMPLWTRDECAELVALGFSRDDVLCGMCIKTVLWASKKTKELLEDEE